MLPYYTMTMKNRGKKKRKNNLAKVEALSAKATTWIGSPLSVVLHTLFFAGAFTFILFGARLESVLLVLTTVVSLEAIYLSIFIQMTVNRNTAQLGEVVEDIEEIQEDVDEIQEDVEGIEKDVDEIQKDVDGLEENFEEISVEIEKDDEEEKRRDKELLNKIEGSLNELMSEISKLRKK